MLVECPKCNGSGKQISLIIFTNCKDGTGRKEFKHPVKCRLCDGTGKVTWIDRIMRKEQ